MLYRSVICIIIVDLSCELNMHSSINVYIQT